MGIWFLEYLTIQFRTGHVRIRVFDFNMKVQHALILKAFCHMATTEPVNVMMDIINMLPKIVFMSPLCISSTWLILCYQQMIFHKHYSKTFFHVNVSLLYDKVCDILHWQISHLYSFSFVWNLTFCFSSCCILLILIAHSSMIPIAPVCSKLVPKKNNFNDL